MGRFNAIDVEETKKMVVRISSIASDSLTAEGVNLSSGRITISLTTSPSGLYIIPSINEEWVVVRHWDDWVLHSKTIWQNPLYASRGTAGETKIGADNSLILTAGHVAIKSDSSIERTVTVSSAELPGATGFVKYQVAPGGIVFCWGEVSFTALTGTPALRNLTTFNNLTSPTIKIRPLHRQFFAGMATVTGGTFTAVNMLLDTNGKLGFYNVSGTSTTNLSFSTSWYVPQ